MISILNRRELYTGTDAEDAARVWSTLKAEGIAYKMQTKGVRSSLAQGRRAGMGMGVTGGAARYSDYADAANYVYTIYVKTPTSPARRSSWGFERRNSSPICAAGLQLGAVCSAVGQILYSSPRRVVGKRKMPPIGRHF